MDQAIFFLILLSGTFGISSSFYYPINYNYTWEEAQSFCRANYIDLPTVDSMDLVTYLNKTGKPGPMWIGLKRSWGWSAGASLNSNYTPWSASHPNGGNREAACGLHNASKWSDNLCSSSFNFFCFDGSPTASKRIVLVTTPKTWVDAQTYCKQRYTDLAFINNTADDADVSSYSTSGWFGLISSQWSDGSFSTFRYWSAESPETAIDNKCGAMLVATSGAWIGTECNVKQPFFCHGEYPTGQHNYHYINTPTTWLRAQTICRTVHGDLATIDSLNELNRANGVVLGSNDLVWIGLRRSTQSRWGWSRRDEPIYSNWDAGRPNGTGQCAANINNVWQDYNCTVPLFFVCSSKRSGYIMVASKKTWQDAQSYCRSNYSDLATIRTQWEQNQLIALVGRGVYVWIGLFQNTWMWSDQGGLFYRNWAVGQPDSKSGDCAAMKTTDSGKWTVNNCSALHPFICQGAYREHKKIIKIKVSHSGTTNLNDPSMQTVILKAIKNKLKGKDIMMPPYGATLKWKLWRDGRVFAKQGDIMIIT